MGAGCQQVSQQTRPDAQRGHTKLLCRSGQAAHSVWPSLLLRLLPRGQSADRCQWSVVAGGQYSRCRRRSAVFGTGPGAGAVLGVPCLTEAPGRALQDNGSVASVPWLARLGTARAAMEEVDWMASKLNVEHGIVMQHLDSVKTEGSRRKKYLDPELLAVLAA